MKKFILSLLVFALLLPVTSRTTQARKSSKLRCNTVAKVKIAGIIVHITKNCYKGRKIVFPGYWATIVLLRKPGKFVQTIVQLIVKKYVFYLHKAVLRHVKKLRYKGRKYMAFMYQLYRRIPNVKRRQRKTYH